VYALRQNKTFMRHSKDMIEDGWQKKQMTLVGLRHKLVSMLAPKLYSEWQLHYRERPMINFIKENYTEPLVGVAL